MPGRHIKINPMDVYRGLTHEQLEAEGPSPPTDSAEDGTAHRSEPGIGVPPQLHENALAFGLDGFHSHRYHPSDPEAPVGGTLGMSYWNNPSPGEPLNSLNMGDNRGRDGSDIYNQLSYVPSDHGYSPYSTSPSPVITPGESPGLGPTPSFGPVRPPPTHLAIQQPQCNFFEGYTPLGEDVNARRSNTPLGNTLGWTQQRALTEMGICLPAPCTYPPLQDSGEEYEAEAEDEQFDEDGIACGRVGTATTNSHHEIPPKKRRRAFSNDRRIAVHNVRRLGACIRCQYLRESVRLD